ncbi:MAG: Flp pilus assembly complex ATPase component TadA [Rubrobacteraceae bacterium]|nr:Flp pilus assembly complex ATPase component TadA [Rubrobacteraceae bacterium]
MSSGVITGKQLEEAYRLGRRQRQGVGKVLLSLGYVGQSDLARAIAVRLRLDFVELSVDDVDPEAACLVDKKLLRRYGMLPLRVEGGRLVVAMKDPANLHALEDLEMLSGYPVSPVVVAGNDLRRVFGRVFGEGDEVAELLVEASAEAPPEDREDVELREFREASGAPTVRLVGSILRRAAGDGASDIHLEPRGGELVVRFRVDGVLREVMSVPPALQGGVVARLKVLASLDIAERRLPQDGRFSATLDEGKLDLRVSTLPTTHGETVVLRLLDNADIQTDLRGLGFSRSMLQQYEAVFRRPCGTILVTGPTGSGKSTTLYATLGEINTPERNIVTVEDPVEYRMHGINQVQVNPRIGLSFPTGLRSILRCDPDVVMIGEIRDRETAKTSVEAALTGHLVLATLHTNNAPAAVTRLTDMGVEPFLTASAVDCVIAQRLVRRLCGRCKRPTKMDERAIRELGLQGGRFAEDQKNFHTAVGCERCAGTGYAGRIGVYEIMLVDEKLRRLILQGASSDELASAARLAGMIPLREDGLSKAAQGVTTVQEILLTVI